MYFLRVFHHFSEYYPHLEAYLESKAGVSHYLRTQYPPVQAFLSSLQLSHLAISNLKYTSN